MKRSPHEVLETDETEVAADTSATATVSVGVTHVSLSGDVKATSSRIEPPRKKQKVKKAKLSESEFERRYKELSDSLPSDFDLGVLSAEILPSWIPKRTLHYIMENHATAPCVGVGKWLSNQRLMRQLLFDRRFHSLSSAKQLKKEMTEASSQLDSIESILSEHSMFDAIHASSGRNLILVDVCSGKGFFGVLLTNYYTNAQIVLCDKDRKMNLKHVGACPNVHFQRVDILAHGFSLAKWIQEQITACIVHFESEKRKTKTKSGIADAKKTETESFAIATAKVSTMSAGLSQSIEEKEDASTDDVCDVSCEMTDGSGDEEYTVIVTGTHLCGQLSMTIVDAFNQLTLPTTVRLCALLLVPCCFPKKDKSVLIEAAELGVDAFQLWCQRLHDRIEPAMAKATDESVVGGTELAPMTCSVQMVTHKHTLSCRNTCIIAVNSRTSY